MIRSDQDFHRGLSRREDEISPGLFWSAVPAGVGSDITRRVGHDLVEKFDFA